MMNCDKLKATHNDGHLMLFSYATQAFLTATVLQLNVSRQHTINNMIKINALGSSVNVYFQNINKLETFEDAL